jgi:hypothetical protein
MRDLGLNFVVHPEPPSRLAAAWRVHAIALVLWIPALASIGFVLRHAVGGF